jgi:hypothetical protein
VHKSAQGWPAKRGFLTEGNCQLIDPKSADKWVAAKQVTWLEKVLAEEHERDKKHADRIELPD